MTADVIRQRRLRGSGSVHFRERDGLWCGQVDLPRVNGRRQRRTVYGQTREAVEAQMRTLTGVSAEQVRAGRRPTTMDDARALATHTEEQWQAKRDAIGCCIYCGVTGPLERDHAVPITRGGDDSIGNVVPACPACNSAKGTMTAREFVTERQFA